MYSRGSLSYDAVLDLPYTDMMERRKGVEKVITAENEARKKAEREGARKK